MTDQASPSEDRPDELQEDEKERQRLFCIIGELAKWQDPTNEMGSEPAEPPDSGGSGDLPLSIAPADAQRAAPPEASSTRSHIARDLARELIRLLIIAALVYLGLRLSIQTVVIESGSSMEPNLHAGEYLIISKMVYLFRSPQRGDVVVAYPPFGVPWIKRVIAVPGDTVEIKNGALYLNGQRIEEPYLNEPIRYTFSPQLIPAGYYFVLGDNRNPSVDSHLAGPLPRTSIIGKAWFIYWPPRLWGGVPHYNLKPG
jgi:signal peptidase I